MNPADLHQGHYGGELYVFLTSLGPGVEVICVNVENRGQWAQSPLGQTNQGACAKKAWMECIWLLWLKTYGRHLEAALQITLILGA